MEIMLTHEQENEIIKLAFFKELEKQAGWGSMATKVLPKVFRGLSKIAPEGGKYSTFATNAEKAFSSSFSEGSAYLSKFKQPSFIKGEDGMWTQAVRNAPAEDNWLAKGIGRTMTELGGLGKGVGAETGIINKSKKVFDNIVQDTKRQISDSTKKVLTPDKYQGSPFNKKNIFGRTSKNQYLKTDWGRTRKIVGQDSAGNPIISKGLGGKVMGVSMTPAGFAATSAAFGNPKDGIAEYALWKTPLGEIKMNYDIVKSGFDAVT